MPNLADIIEVTTTVGGAVTDRAVVGDTVQVSVKIKNNYTLDLSVAVSGALEYGVTPWPGINFPADKLTLPPGWVGLFNGYFTMPDRNVTVHAYSYWYGSDGMYHFDDEMTKLITLTELVPTFSEFAISSFSRV